MTIAKKPVPMCCVTIGIIGQYIMPADKGMKLVELLQTAFEANRNYADRGYVYDVGDQPEVEFALVKPSQIRAKATNAAGQRLLK